MSCTLESGAGVGYGTEETGTSTASMPAQPRSPHRSEAASRPQPVAALPQMQPVAALPQMQPVAALPQMQPVAALPQMQPAAVLPQIQPVAVLPQIQPVAALPQMQPVDALPQMQPVAVLPQMQPAAPSKADRPYDTVCMAGGGVCGVAYLGALRALNAAGVLDWLSPQRHVRTFIGTSVGGLFAMLACAKVDILRPSINDLVREFLQAFLWRPHELLRNGRKLGLGTGASCVTFLERLLYTRYRRSGLTLGNLHDVVGGQLVLVCSCATTARPLYFSHTTHPNVRVSDATFATMALPFLFEPYRVYDPLALLSLPFDASTGTALRAGQVIECATQETIGGQQRNDARVDAHFDAQTDGRVDAAADHVEYVVREVDARSCTVHVVQQRVHHCIDGCFVNNNPFMMAPPDSRVLNLQLRNSTVFDVRTQPLHAYVAQVMMIGVRRVEDMCEQAHASRVDRDVIFIDTSDASSTNFHMSRAEVMQLLKYGEVAARDFVSRLSRVRS